MTDNSRQSVIDSSADFNPEVDSVVDVIIIGGGPVGKMSPTGSFRPA